MDHSGLQRLAVTILAVGACNTSNVLASDPVGGSNEVVRLPEVTVTGMRFQEEQPVGPYQQPEWTTARRFPTTRVYLQQQPGEFGIEQWVKAQWPRGGPPSFGLQEEIEFGLPHRFQFDVYENWDIGAVETDVHVPSHKVMQDSVSTELRWALADWGKIPLNPTLYGEWTFRNHDLGADRYEFKLLLGEDLAPRWHWGFNLIYEQEVGATRTTEYALSQGIGYTLLDEKLSLGMEIKLESETEAGKRGPAPCEVDIGPSLQWRPTRNTHLDLVPLVGVTSDSPHLETWIVFGVDFGPGNEQNVHAPVSLQSR